MKLYLLPVLLFLAFNVFAQNPPQAFNYSGVARDALGNPLSNRTLAVEIGILKGSVAGQVQYIETHNVTTDQFGLFNLVIGAGAIQSGSISAVSWGSDNYFLRVSFDMNGGTNFTLLGTTQLLSVPYALHAGTAASLGGNGGHYLGEEFGGGVIFHLYRDSSGVEHGLIVAPNDISISTSWDSTASCLAGTCVNVRYAESTWNGAANTAAIVNDVSSPFTAASQCDNYSSGGFSDWYMPSLQELNMIWNNLFDVNRTMESMPGAETMRFAVYWSSTEIDSIGAWMFSFMTGQSSYWDKIETYHLRAIRKF
jgi:hypothetical protein